MSAEKQQKLYSARWYAKEIQAITTEPKTKELAVEQVKILSELIGDEQKPPEAAPILVKGAGSRRIPFAVQHGKLRERGTYEGGYPKGAVVHYTAGRSGGLKKAKSAIDYAATQGHTYLVIGSDGSVVQGHDIDQWGYHAGESAWKNPKFAKSLVGTVSDDLIGIEINNAGQVKKQSDGTFITYFGEILKSDEVRYVDKSYGCPAGYYHKYTPQQESALIETLLFLKQNDPFGVFSFDLCIGHHECAGILGLGYWRKPDPGGALSMPMEKFRDFLKAEYQKRNA